MTKETEVLMTELIGHIHQDSRPIGPGVLHEEESILTGLECICKYF